MQLHKMVPVVVLIGCTTPNVVPTSGSARFSEYPQDLFAAIQASCAGPAQSFSQPTRDSVECAEFMPPEITAAMILNYDGTPEELPRLVIRFSAQKNEPGYLVHNDIFVNVPQKQGADRQVRMPDPKINRRLNMLYKHAGGVPE
jgi:hypothetical protein